MSGSVKSSDLPSAVASQIHERHNYQREDTQRSFGHSGPPSFLKYCQPPFPAGPQTQAQTYQTSHPQSSSGHGRPPSLVEHKQLPFPAVPQTPAQTYQTSHPQSSSHHDRPPSLLEHKTGSQTPVKKYKTSHPQTWGKPGSHEIYSTGQCGDSAEPAVRQITSESSLPPGEHVTTTLA
ncbi:uncharacterized protein LOC110052693 isoform X2 [Orbicella faveolata]|uniref:uncharacterized protein LOC110052693 isoform X2 n=1 Tax=Orbicella faveolata TaxID=48498 RepID=UPI0009E2D684|nr:uncharacterized protein LOC110052693 isoform X2 [Orbicella faveolata]